MANVFSVIIVIIEKSKSRGGRYNNKHFLTLTPAGAESDLNATMNSA